MKTLTLLFGIACVITLVGCATGPDFKTYTSTLSSPKKGESRVWIYRPSKMFGSGIQPIVKINDLPIAKAQPGCFFYADKPSGAYVIKCTTESTHTAQLTMTQNHVYYVRLTVFPGVLVYHIMPRVVSEEQGLREMQHCRLITANGMNKDWKSDREKTAKIEALEKRVEELEKKP